MKRFKYILRAIFVVLLINLTANVWAQNISGGNPTEYTAPQDPIADDAPAWLDSVDISLLTCGPGQEVWSYYGHTALRIEDHAHGTDLAVNWGMFTFQQDYFILRFVFGMTDYQIGIFPMSRFVEEYAYEGRWVKQQRLALTRKEKMTILAAIDENNKEENRTYRYNFFFDNCTTRARDMIIKHLGAHDTDFKNVGTQTTYRKEIHRWNENHRWARFGNDLLLGYLADRPINKKEWEFLPTNLSDQFYTEARKDTASQYGTRLDVYPERANYIKLVDSTFYVIPPQAGATEAETEPITPFSVFIALGIVILLACAYEIYSHKNLWWIDTILLTLTGLPGIILLAMVFSLHPTVQINFQILILNPLNLLFVWSVSKRLRKGKMHWYYNLWGFCLALALGLAILQDYAEGMCTLALSLLVRYCTRSAIFVINKEKERKRNHKK